MLTERAAIAFSIDAAGGVTASADPSVIAVMATDGLNYYIEHREIRKAAYYELKQVLFEMDGAFKPQRIWCESSSNGIALIDDVKQTSSLPIMPVKVTRSKVDRARAVAGLFEAGKVKIRTDAPWYGDLLKDFLSFPNGRHDDIVDAVCMALAIFRESTAAAQITTSFITLSDMRQRMSDEQMVPWNAVPGINYFAGQPGRSKQSRYGRHTLRIVV